MKSLTVLWDDSRGFVVSVELVLVTTIAVLGLIVGLTSVRDGVVCEISDVAGSVQDLNQSYRLSGLSGHSASTVGSDYRDALDFCDDADSRSGRADNCIQFTSGISDEGVIARQTID